MEWTNGSLYGWERGWTAGPRVWQSMMQQFFASWGKTQGTGAGLAQPGGEEAEGEACMSNSCVKGGYSGHAEKHSE